MSTNISPLERNMTDPEGRPIVPQTPSFDAFGHKLVWAVYRIQHYRGSAEARVSDVADLATAKTTADALNRTRGAGEIHYFKVYRLADPLLFGSA